MRIAFMAIALVLLAASGRSQTLGVPGLNDMTVNGMGSGTTSCTAVGPAGISGVPITFAIFASPTSTGAALFIDVCPCSPAVATYPNSCHPLLFSRLDIGTCVLMNVPMRPGPVPGSYFAAFPPLPTGLTFSAQGVVLDASCAPVWPFVFTQAYDITT